MNLLLIRTYARTLVAEANPLASYSSDSDFNSYINEGVRDMCVKGHVYEETMSMTAGDGVPSYTLPIDALPSVRSVINPFNVALDPMTPAGVGKLYIVAGKPLYYYISNSPLATVTWTPSTIFTLGSIILPTVGNGFMYEVTQDGMSGITEPTYPTSPGTSVIDNNAILMCRGLATSLYEIVLVDTPTTVGGGVGMYTVTYHAIDTGLYVDTDCPNFPEDKHHILSLYACYRHFVKMKDLTRATGLYADYAAGAGIQAPQPASGGQ